MAAHAHGIVRPAVWFGVEADARKRKKGRKAARPLGGIDKCTVCGKEYVVKSGRQKYCPDCAYEAVRKVDRPASRAWNQANKETYYPARNEKRRKERAENPELVRAKERAAYAKRKSKT